METEGSLPHSQVPATCSYPEPARSSSYRTSHTLKIHHNLNIILPHTLQDDNPVTLKVGEARTFETSEENTQCNSSDACHMSNVLRPRFRWISHKIMFCTDEEIKSQTAWLYRTWYTWWSSPRRPRRGVEVKFYSFFYLGIRWGGWSKTRSGRFTPVNCTGGWLGPRASLDGYGKSHL